MLQLGSAPVSKVCTLPPRFFRQVMEESFAGREQPITAEGLSHGRAAIRGLDRRLSILSS